MALLECERCKVDILEYKDRVQVLDATGFTHTFCAKCGEGLHKKIEESNRSIKEFGKYPARYS